MNTLETLYLVLWALYLLESYDLAAKDEVVIAEGLTGYKRAEGRLCFKHPFPGQRLFAFGPDQGLGLSWDVTALRARLEEYQKATRWLRAISQVLFIVLFIVMPTLYVRLESQPYNFIAGLVSALVLWWSASAALFYADRQLNKGGGVSRVQRLLHAMIAPGYALRGSEALSREWLKPWSALAAAAVLMKRADFEALCQTALLDELYRAQCAPRLSELWLFGALSAEARDRFLHKQNLDQKLLLADPEAAHGASKTFCPRCRSQFVLKSGICSDCAMPLKVFKNLVI